MQALPYKRLELMDFSVAGFAKKASQGGVQVMKNTHESTSVPEAVSSSDKKSPRVRAV